MQFSLTQMKRRWLLLVDSDGRPLQRVWYGPPVRNCNKENAGMKGAYCVVLVSVHPLWCYRCSILTGLCSCMSGRRRDEEDGAFRPSPWHHPIVQVRQ